MATTEVTPVRKVGPTWVLELFHGPTFAFKVRPGGGHACI